MAVLPVATLRAQYLTLSTAFITEVNTGSIVLSYPEVLPPTTNNNLLPNAPTIIDMYGGRQPLDNLTDHSEESGSNLHVVPQTETIPARVYWINKKYDQNGVLIDIVNGAKTITYASDSDKIATAVFGTIDGVRVKIKQPPIPYGLFGKQWAITYWETF